MGNPDKCANCGEQAAHKHHVVPKSLGGTDQLSNLVDLCESCHGKVHSRNFTNHMALQRVGIERAKRLGKYKGRPPTIDPKKVYNLYLKGYGPTDIEWELRITRQSVYRLLNQHFPSWKTDRLGESYVKA